MAVALGKYGKLERRLEVGTGGGIRWLNGHRVEDHHGPGDDRRFSGVRAGHCNLRGGATSCLSESWPGEAAPFD